MEWKVRSVSVYRWHNVSNQKSYKHNPVFILWVTQVKNLLKLYMYKHVENRNLIKKLIAVLRFVSTTWTNCSPISPKVSTIRLPPNPNLPTWTPSLAPAPCLSPERYCPCILDPYASLPYTVRVTAAQLTICLLLLNYKRHCVMSLLCC